MRWKTTPTLFYICGLNANIVADLGLQVKTSGSGAGRHRKSFFFGNLSL